MNIPDPVLIKNSGTMRDGGSYMLSYQSADGGLFEITLKVIMSSEFKRIGYRPPTICSYNLSTFQPSPSEQLSWEQGAALRAKLLPLLSSSVEFGGNERAAEMLQLLALNGAVE